MVKDLTGISGAHGSHGPLPPEKGIPTPETYELPKHPKNGHGKVESPLKTLFGLDEKPTKDLHQRLVKVTILCLGIASKGHFPTKKD